MGARGGGDGQLGVCELEKCGAGGSRQRKQSGKGPRMVRGPGWTSGSSQRWGGDRMKRLVTPQVPGRDRQASLGTMGSRKRVAGREEMWRDLSLRKVELVQRGTAQGGGTGGSCREGPGLNVLTWARPGHWEAGGFETLRRRGACGVWGCACMQDSDETEGEERVKAAGSGSGGAVASFMGREQQRRVFTPTPSFKVGRMLQVGMGKGPPSRGNSCAKAWRLPRGQVSSMRLFTRCSLFGPILVLGRQWRLLQ